MVKPERSLEVNNDGDMRGPEKPKRGHGPRCQPQLPMVEQVHELGPEEMDCDVCGGTVAEMSNQFEESEEITAVERSFVIVKHKRKKYRCSCNAKVVTAPSPPKLIPGGRYSVEFAVEVATARNRTGFFQSMFAE